MPRQGWTLRHWREYDAATGRWTVEDPIQFQGNDYNVYRYAASDPVNYSDISGLKTVKDRNGYYEFRTHDYDTPGAFATLFGSDAKVRLLKDLLSLGKNIDVDCDDLKYFQDEFRDSVANRTSNMKVSRFLADKTHQDELDLEKRVLYNLGAVIALKCRGTRSSSGAGSPVQSPQPPLAGKAEASVPLDGYNKMLADLAELRRKIDEEDRPHVHMIGGRPAHNCIDGRPPLTEREWQRQQNERLKPVPQTAASHARRCG